MALGLGLLVALAPTAAEAVSWQGRLAATAAASQDDQDEKDRDEEPAQEAGSIWDRLELYGRLKVDASWDENTIDPGNFARWVVSPSVVEEHSHFNLTVRETRLGLRIAGVRSESFTVDGRVEIDFYGGGAENREGILLRHAFAALAWPQSGFGLLLGQSSDVISPLVPRTLNYPVAWWVGNIGYRRPQIRASQELGDGAHRLVLTGAVTRTIGDDFAELEPGDSGADSGVPTIQGRVGWSWGHNGSRPGALGVSGHWGQERLKESLGDADPEFDSWSLNVDLSVPLGEHATVRAEAFDGENLDDYLGGIGQGIDRGRGTEIGSSGGWLSVEGRALEHWLLAVGAGVDDPDDEDVPGGGRTRNTSVWANVIRELPYSMSTGLELSWWDTEYREREAGSSLRVQASFIWEF